MLKILRGLAANLPVPLEEGRMAVTMDPALERLYVGVTSGNLRIATYSDLTQQISNLKGIPPFSLNTLQKLATAINNDANFSTTIQSALSTKASLSQLSTKADITYVNAQDAALAAAITLKADVSYVNNQLALKATISYVDSQLALKADEADLISIQNDLSALQTVVSGKADSNQVSDLAASGTIFTNVSAPISIGAIKSKIFITYTAEAPVTINLPPLSSVFVNWTLEVFRPSTITVGSFVTFHPSSGESIDGVVANYVGLLTDKHYVLVNDASTTWRLQVVS